MTKLRISHFKVYSSVEEMPGQIQQIVRLRIKSGAATSGPPIGPVLGQYAIPISKFCTEFNDRTIELFKRDVDVFVTIFYLVDGSYNFDIGIPISSICLRIAARIKRTTGKPIGRQVRTNRCRRWAAYGVISQYMLFELIMYRDYWSDCIGNNTIQSLYNKYVGTLHSVGLIPYKFVSIS